MKHTSITLLALSMIAACGGDGGDHGAAQHEGHPSQAHSAHGGAPSPEHAGHDGHEGHTALPATAPIAGDSLYQLGSPFTDQDGRPFAFSSLRGHPTLIVMFYGSCETMCPVLLEDLRSIDESLTPETRARTRLVLVSFDPERDTEEKLRALLTERGFDRGRTTALRGPESSVRELSMVLGVQYRRLADGNYSHTALISLLDPEGVIAGRIEGLNADPASIVTALSAYR